MNRLVRFCLLLTVPFLIAFVMGCYVLDDLVRAARRGWHRALAHAYSVSLAEEPR